VLDRQWKRLGYVDRPAFDQALSEYDAFVKLLRDCGCAPLFLPVDNSTTIDSIYVRDAAILTDAGAVLSRMGKAARSEEPSALETSLTRWGVPILGRIAGDGRVEGGDVVWLDGSTVAVGRGYRTNDAGLEQLVAFVEDLVDNVIVVPLPHWNGPDDVFHLMSIFSPVDHDLALVYSPLLPVPFREELLARGLTLIEVPAAEFQSLGCNVLAVAPRTCIVVEGNVETRRRLEHAGVRVFGYRGTHISGMGLGGPTCLTRPLERRRA
jgi:N-dimethylarginine dimethylaminohydrolase